MQRGGYRSPENTSPNRSVRGSSPSRYSSSSRHSSQRRSSVYSIDMGDRLPARSRKNSSARPDNTNAAAPPLHDTIQSAVRSADAASKIDAGLIAQITAEVTQNVINKFKSDGIPPDTSSSANSSPSLSPQSVPTRPGGRNLSRSPPTLESQYMPPSPGGKCEFAGHHRSSSPEYSETSSHASTNMARPTKPRGGASSPPRNEDIRERPQPTRTETAIHEETTLEKVWCPLFDNGRPTARLGQFLRGIAVHLIEDCEPKGSLVVTPRKMVAFFKTTRLPDEIYPFQDIFGGKCTNASISRIYRGLGAQHQLTQFNNGDEPTIPGLTPHGFEVWMTNLILAHPDKEFERLSKTLIHMPISNADSRAERFPKELPRRLLPGEADRNVQQKLYSVISADRSIQLGRSSDPVPPPPSQPPPQISPPRINTAYVERDRERNTYAEESSSDGSEEDDDNTPRPRAPIERERQPYTARQGTGKIYNDRGNEQETGPYPGRLNSAASATSAYAMDVPPRMSQLQHRSSVSGARQTFQNSPPSVGAAGPRNPFIRSEGANVNEVQNSHYASNIPSIASMEEEIRAYPSRRSDDPAGGSGQWNTIPPPPVGRGSPGSSFDAYGRERDPRGYEDRRRGSVHPGSGASKSATEPYGPYYGGSAPRY